jgi:hypothetical protein
LKKITTEIILSDDGKIYSSLVSSRYDESFTEYEMESILIHLYAHCFKFERQINISKERQQELKTFALTKGRAYNKKPKDFPTI